MPRAVPGRVPTGASKTGGERRRPQMADVARLAGVSVSTVSRALNGSSLIPEETRQRIAELARSLDYAINVSAQNLRLQHNNTVAVVIPYDKGARQHVSDPFFLAMVGSLADALTERGFDMLLSRVDAEDLGSAARLFGAGVASGVILIGQWRHHDQLDELAARQVPIVVWGAQLPGQRYCSVGGDNVAGGALATGHLIRQGAQRIVFIGNPQLPEVGHRHRGYLAEMAAAGIAPDPRWLLDVPFDAERTRVAMSRLCEQGMAFDGVFACSDVLASAAMQVLHRFGLRVPEDVAVVGYDDIEWASHSNPPLTTVRQPIRQAGAAMVDALLRIVAGETVPPLSLPVELVVRASTRRLA